MSWIRYAEREVIFDAARRDRRSAITLNIARSFWGDSLTVAAGLTHIRNQSNLELNQYQRQLVTIQMTHAF